MHRRLIERDLGKHDPSLVELLSANPQIDRGPRIGTVVEPGMTGRTILDRMRFDANLRQAACEQMGLDVVPGTEETDPTSASPTALNIDDRRRWAIDNGLHTGYQRAPKMLRAITTRWI